MTEATKTENQERAEAMRAELKKKTKDELITIIFDIGERGAQEAKRVSLLSAELDRHKDRIDVLADMLVEERKKGQA